MTAVPLYQLLCDEVGCPGEATKMANSDRLARDLAYDTGWRSRYKPPTRSQVAKGAYSTVVQDFCPVHAGSQV